MARLLENEYRNLKKGEILKINIQAWFIGICLVISVLVIPVAHSEKLVYLFNFTYIQKYASGGVDPYQNLTVSLDSGSFMLGDVGSMTRLIIDSSSTYYVEIPSVTNTNVTLMLGNQNITLNEDTEIALDTNKDSKVELGMGIVDIKNNKALINITNYEQPVSFLDSNRSSILLLVGVIALFWFLFGRH